MGQEIGLLLGSEWRPLVHDYPWPLSSPSLLPEQVCRDEGDRMALTVPMQFESVVTELSQEAFVGSSIENGTTIMQFALRKLDLPCP
jgi:hypothetical protein